MEIPLVDLRSQHAEVAAEIWEGFERLFNSSAYILGEEVALFEDAFARFSGVSNCVGVANGTDALELILRAAGVGPGDEVVVPANSFVASALAVVRAGATPVFADVDPVYLLLDAEDLSRRITPACKALLPVHLYGQIPAIEDILDVAASRGLLVIEDAAQAQGASRKGVTAGGFGLAAGVSFYPGKNLGAYGDAGAVLTGSAEVAGVVRNLRNYGTKSKYHHTEIGFNSRLDSMQAVVLNAKLRRLPEWNERRRAAAQLYQELLGDMKDVALPSVLPGNEHIWHLYVVRVPDRDRVVRELNSEGIGAGVHYPVPIHLQPAFRGFGHKEGDFPTTEAAAREVLSLPLYPEITEAQQRRVAEVLARALR